MIPGWFGRGLIFGLLLAWVQSAFAIDAVSTLSPAVGLLFTAATHQ
jgi:hypothetical protein